MTAEDGDLKTISQHTSQATLTPTSLPDGCSYGYIPSKEAGVADERVIWVDFPPASPQNPLFFSSRRKLAITVCVLIFTWMSAFTTSAYSISASAMCDEFGCNSLEAEAGVALYAWAAGLMPLCIAPISEELGRRPVYLFGLALFWVFHLVNAVAQNTATVLVSRFVTGMAGSIGSGIAAGSLSDIYTPAHRGFPMLLSGFCVYFSTGLGGTAFAYVTTHLGWRWVWWIHVIYIGATVPLFIFMMPETRSVVILRRWAAKLRKQRGLQDGGRYLTHAEMEKVKLITALRTSLVRPLVFLTTEPLCVFFALWVGLAWSVMYVQLAGLPYMMRNIYGFDTEGVGLMYLTTSVGALFGIMGGLIQDRLYRRMAPTKGVEARLYAPMFGGVLFAIGCFITGFTAIPGVPWIASAIGQVVMIAAIMTIYVTAFTYISECYGIYASSAIAGQSCSRNLVGGCIGFATTSMFEGMTVRWAIVMMGGIASVLALVPFGAYIYGPKIRARSKYSRLLMHQEREAMDEERVQRQVRGMDTAGMEDYEGDANEKDIPC